MPIFEFQCEDCGRGFERLLLNREAPVECPACGSPEVVKQFSTFSMQADTGFSGSLGAGCGCAPTG